MTTKSEVLRIPRAERLRVFGLWAMAGAWSSKELSDGHIPEHMLEELAGRPKDAQALVDVGLWRAVDDGWQFNDWSPTQPLREKVLEERKKSSQRVQDFRTRNSSGNAVTNSVTNDVDNSETNGGVADAPSLPFPSLPNNSSSKSGGKKPEIRIPADWAPTAAHFTRARESNVDIASAVEAFKLHAATHDRHAANWNAAFTTWLTKATPAAPVRRNPDAWMNR